MYASLDVTLVGTVVNSAEGLASVRPGSSYPRIQGRGQLI